MTLSYLIVIERTGGGRIRSSNSANLIDRKGGGGRGDSRDFVGTPIAAADRSMDAS